jgi:hypothetical protein
MIANLSSLGTHARLSRRDFVASGLAASLLPTRAFAQANKLKLGRGGSIHSMLNWPELEAGSRERFAWPPFSTAKYQMSPRLLGAFRRAGLDFIRLTVDPGIFMASNGARRDELDAILLSRCRLILESGLNVIVDFHPISQVAAWTPDRIITDERTNKLFLDLIERTARVIRALDASRVALEFMNEPPHGYENSTASRWQRMLVAMHSAARAVHPDLTLVMTGAASGGIKGLMNVDARVFNDANVYWSFHYYSPHHFTHQGVATSQSNMLHFRYLTELPYPANAASPDLTMETIRQAIRSDSSLNQLQRLNIEQTAMDAVRTYFKSSFDARSIAAEFDKVVEWAGRNGISADKILLGEFGAARRNNKGNGALNRHRLDWLRDIRVAAEQRSFAWALWDIDDNQMGLVTQRGSGILDAQILKALGLDDMAG